jgi:lysozyme family protein
MRTTSPNVEGRMNMTYEQTKPVCAAAGEPEDLALEAAPSKPNARQESTTHKSSRSGTPIDHIVVHYTTSRSIEGTISHFKTGTPRTSAHYIVGRDGALVQMVADDERAWHAGNADMNARSIGIEHVAKLGDKITDAQSSASIALIRYLMGAYRIPASNIIPHVCVKSTDCCGDLFKDFGGGAGLSCAQQRQAARKWLGANGIGVETEEFVGGRVAEWVGSAAVAGIAAEGASASQRLAMAKIIVDFEARRDAQGRLVVYTLRPEDGGGRYEVAGINERYHKAVCDELVDLIRRGRYDEAETRAAEFVASYTDRAQAWTQNPGLEFFLRDTMFNRGPGGAAWVLQKALGVAIDRDVGGETLAALRAAEGRPHDLLDRMRAAREANERLNRDHTTSIFWRGLVNRWNKARQAAQIFMQASEGETPVETAALRAGVDEAIAPAAAGGTDEGPDRLRQQRDTDLHERLRSRRQREALSDEGEPNLDLAGGGENLTVRASLIENNDDLALERVLGHSDLLPIHWLQRGLNVARSVCRVAVRDQAGVTLVYGTGSMIAPDLI